MKELPANMVADEAASYLRIHPQTLTYWRSAGKGPTYIKMGRRVIYRRIDLDDWLDRCAVTVGRDAAQPAPAQR